MRYTFIFFCFFNLHVFAQNNDFESSIAGPVTSSTQILGWLFTSDTYSVPNSVCTRFCDSLLVPMSASIITQPVSGYIDPFIGSQYPIFSVFGNNFNAGLSCNKQLDETYGNSFLKIGYSSSIFYNVSKRFKVDYMNCIFRYAYVYAGKHSYSSGCCNGPVLKTRVRDITTSSAINTYSRIVLFDNPCATSPVDVFANAGTVNTYYYVYGDEAYCRWKVINIDFSNYIGDSIRIDFVVNGGNSNTYCYAYLDAGSRPGMIYANGIINTTGSVTTCGNATLSATPGYNYNWKGPNVNNAITQSIVANASGVYSLTMSQGTAVIGSQTIHVNINVPGSINMIRSEDTICAGQTVTLTIDYNDVGHLKWFRWYTSSAAPSITINPSVNPKTIYYIEGVDTNNCYTYKVDSIQVNLCTGLRENSLTKWNFDVFPNPNSGTFVLSSNEDEKIFIYDNLGKLIQTFDLNQTNDHKCTVHNFKPGVYLVRGLGTTRKIVVLD